jgi:hypothetical protein
VSAGFVLDKQRWIARHEDFRLISLETTEVDVRRYDRTAIVRCVGKKVHVVPAVSVAGLAPFRTLRREAGVLSDAARRDVRRRVGRLNAV